MEELFRFPENLQARMLDSSVQAAKVMEESEELSSAIDKAEGEFRSCCEAWDVIQAAEGILRKHSEDMVRLSHAEVMLRCSRRGDYADILPGLDS